jgi:hypothetical protein
MPFRKTIDNLISLRALIAGSALAAGAFAAAPAAAQSVCTVQPGGIINCTAPLPAPIPPGSGTVNVTGSPDPLTVTLADGFVSTGPITLGTVGGGDINVVSTGTSTIQNAGPGLVADSSGGINADVTNISTTGDNATAALLRATDDIIFTSDGTIATAGANSPGVDAQGRSVTLNLNNVNTTGPNSQGVEAGSVNGPTTVNFNAINTSGNGSPGAIVTSTGDSTLTGHAISTGGTDAAAFDISNNAAGCVVLGAGGCDNTVALDQVTTNGFGSTGGLVSSAGRTNVKIGVLRTGGDQAAGIDLTADPTSCATIGAGACDTAFTVGTLQTQGARSPGAIFRGAGGISGTVGVLQTNGNQAAGLDLASDPTACAVLGAGACNTSFSAGQLTTNGDGSTGALVRSAGNTNGSVGVLSTKGNDSPGIDIASSPTACVIGGVGACDVGLTAGSVSTQGDRSAGVLINNAGATNGDFGTIATGGNNAPGLGITQDPAACLAVGPGSCRINTSSRNTQTRGAGSPGISLLSPGPIGLVAGVVATAGPASNAIQIAGGGGAVNVLADAVTTAGAGSNGIVVSSTTGAQTITAGHVNVLGAGANGIVATAACADINITARDAIVSAQGSAIVANSACGVTVTTLPGASVTGATAGINATSGTGATINVGDLLTATAGPALNTDGAAANVTIAPTGTIAGRIDLTDNADLLTNNGVFAPVGTSNFGLGADLFVNAGRLRVAGAPVLGGLESTVNRGVVDFRNGGAGDQLTLSGDFTGAAGSQLAIDVAGSVNGTPADRLIVGGNAAGTTAVTLNLIGGPGVANPTGTVIVDAASAAGGAFTLAGPTRSGFVDYSLRQSGGRTLLVALPNQAALEPLLLGGIGLDFWYQSADSWSGSATLRRSDLGSASPRGTSFWMQGYGGNDKRGATRAIDVFGTTNQANLRFDTDRRGAQGGLDLRAGASLALGVTGGYQRSASHFASGTRAILEGYNVGGYMLYGGPTGLYAELLAKADFFKARLANGGLFAATQIDGKSYGAEGELGYRLLFGMLHADVGAGLAYVRTDLDPLTASGFRFDFDRAQSLRGRVGVRLEGSGKVAPYADLKLLHEFKAGDHTTLASGGVSLDLPDRAKGTWVRGELGLTGAPDRSGGFVSAWAEAGDVRGYGVRLGFRW